MKKSIAGVLMAIVASLIVSVPAFAATKDSGKKAGPFEGVFRGTVTGDYGSKASLTLDLTDRDNIVAGDATLTGGLMVNAGGFCGQATVPSGTMWVEGPKSPKHPHEIAAETMIDLGSFDVTVEVEGQLSADGETLEVEATIDTPWLCGRDPIISGSLTKVG